jgi:hypothetical protein
MTVGATRKSEATMSEVCSQSNIYSSSGIGCDMGDLVAAIFKTDILATQA